MEPGRRTRVVIIGSGNVATHLAKRLDREADVVEIASRDIEHARRLSAQLKNARATDRFDQIATDADVYIISVSDNALEQVVASTPDTAGLWLHTAGSVGMEALSGHKSRYGVLYPMQTFSREVEVDFDQVPLFVEGMDEPTTVEIERIAAMLSPVVRRASSDERRRVHIAAVFGCNFANHLWAISDSLLKEQGMDITLLRPLLQATLDKAMAIGPAEGQTGPAVRRDTRVMASHMASLPEPLRNLYEQLSNSIINTQTTEHK